MVTCCPTTGDQFLHIAPLSTVLWLGLAQYKQQLFIFMWRHVNTNIISQLGPHCQNTLKKNSNLPMSFSFG